MSRKRAAIFCSLAILGTALVWTNMDRRTKAVTPPAPAAVPVTTSIVTQGGVPIILPGLGHVQAFNQATIRPQVGGGITTIDYKQGQIVQQGALLVQIDPRPFQARLDEDQAQLTKDIAHLGNAQTNLGRDTVLARSGVAPVEEMQTQQSMVAQQQAVLAADKAVIAQDKLSLSYASITAPFTGVAGLRLVDVGNIVQADQAQGLVTITQVQPIAVLFTMPQDELPEIQDAMQAAGAQHLAVTAWSEDGTRQLGTGRLTAIDNAIDQSSGTVTLRAVFDNKHERLWPGEFVQVRLQLRVVPDALSVPADVIQQGPNGAYAWVARDGTAQMQPVKLVQSMDGTALVSSGLSAGETVVTDGQYGLSPGAHVTTATAAATASPLRNAQTTMLGIEP